MKETFKKQLETALSTCPIVYIQHFHYNFIDEMLSEILTSEHGRIQYDINIDEELIEFDFGHGEEPGLGRVLDFKTKGVHYEYYQYNNIKSLLAEAVDNRIASKCILLFKNCSSWIEDVELQSLLAMFASKYEHGDYHHLTTIILVSPQPVSLLPIELEKFITAIEPKAPTEEEIMELLKGYDVARRFQSNANRLRLNLCRSLQGLQLYEIKQILKTALHCSPGKKLSERTIENALAEKKNIVRKSGIIEVIDTDVDLNDVGGLENLKVDIKRKGAIFNNLNMAKDAQLPLPKGILILGMPGCGKSMIAKSIAKEFGVSLLRLDVSRLMGQYVGQSEENLRRALATAEAAHPCVLWIDEIEKAFAGASGGGNDNDMLVMRMMGHFLTWMQERKTAVYIVATANDVMRPEFMRKGRFDEVYFVDFPNENEAKLILKKKIERFSLDKNSIFDFTTVDKLSEIASKMKVKNGGFSGSEIESVVNTVVERKFIEFISLKEKDESVCKISVTQQDFLSVIDEIKDSVMANQVSKKDPDTGVREKTNIERIRDLQEKYKFKLASNKI